MKTTQGFGRTEDGVRIFTEVTLSARPKPVTAILLHGFSSHHRNRLNRRLIPILEDLGISTIAFDFRGCGDSNGSLADTTITTGCKDLEAALEFALSSASLVTGEPVLVGSSFGATVALASSKRLAPSLILMKAPLISIRSSQTRKRGEAQMAAWAKQGVLEIETGRGSQLLKYDYVADSDHYDFLEPGALGTPEPKVVIVHGTLDDTASFTDSASFVRAAAGTRQLVAVEGGDHDFDRPGDMDLLVSVFSDALRGVVR